MRGARLSVGGDAVLELVQRVGLEVGVGHGPVRIHRLERGADDPGDEALVRKHALEVVDRVVTGAPALLLDQVLDDARPRRASG